MSPSIPFPASPSTNFALPLPPAPPPPPISRTQTAPMIRSPRTSQDSARSYKRLSNASNASSSTIGSQPRILLRTRHGSLPASVVESRHQSIVGTPAANYEARQVKARNRVSIAASVASFGSVEEEKDIDANTDALISQASRSPMMRESSLIQTRPRAITRQSLPIPGKLPSFATHVGSSNAERVNLDAQETQSRSSQTNVRDRAKREERRRRIAEELRDTEQASVDVLEEIDEVYYQPLLQLAATAAASTNDVLVRRSSKRYSSAASSPTMSPRASFHSPPRSRTTTSDSLLPSSSSPSPDVSLGTSPSTAPTSPPTPPIANGGPILSRKEINEVFANFTDVLNLSHVMILTLNEAVPERPSLPLPVSLVGLSLDRGEQLVGSIGSRLSSSAETLESPVSFPPGDDRPQLRPRSSSTAAVPIRLGKSLLPIVPFLKQYSLFVANFSGSLARLSTLEHDGSGRWHEFVKSRQRVGGGQGGKIGLAGMLLNIVQRVPRYRLLLLELIEFTEHDHPDLRDLRTAYELVNSVATHLESQIESHTHDLEILDLQRSFVNLQAPLLSPGRRLLKFGSLRKLSSNGKENIRLFFLFNDLLLHAAAIEQSPAWGLGIAGVLASSELEDLSATSLEQHSYRLVDQFELEDVTVVGTEAGNLKYAFEILSTHKSFAIISMSKSLGLTRRRVSLPSPIKERSAFLTNDSPFKGRESPVPVLGTIPPTPADEIQALEFPLLDSTARSESPQVASSTSFPTSPEPSRPSRRPSLARTRKWSELRPTDALQAVASAFLPPPAVEGLADDRVEYKVIETYHAPVWVPDSKTDKFVCWACSTKYFIIPGYLLHLNEDRLACSCDTCYSAVFEDPVPSSRFLGSTVPATFSRSTLQPCVDKNATLNRLSRRIDPRHMPIFDQDPTASVTAIPSAFKRETSSVRSSFGNETPKDVELGDQNRRRRVTAVGTLQNLLDHVKR
ncbi:uncharacterized protein JCM15063_002443 [Sporobolomyces koalae]|uniref:uncharacterized protein n=1 Tax=Sporobolomyces koalae TaxID=500713 RepID=UPI003175FE4C